MPSGDASASSVVPILSLEDFDSPDPAVRAKFLADFREAMLSLGFAYIQNHGVPESVISGAFDAAKRFFELPVETKRRIEMVNSPHFVGWNQLGREVTNFAVDYREQIDFGSDSEPAGPDQPLWANLLGPNQYLPEDDCPGFKDAVISYREAMRSTGMKLLHAMALSLGLHEYYFDSSFIAPRPASRMKVVKYPSSTAISKPVEWEEGYLGENDTATDFSQGCGPHRDSGFITLIAQDEIGGLQVQTTDGKWHDVKPIPGTLVCNLGEGCQGMTGGLYVATTHRVLNNSSGRDRYSMPFFFAPHLDADLTPIPKELLAKELLDRMPKSVKTDISALQAKIYKKMGVNYFKSRLRSHPDVAARWWSHVTPDVLDALDEQWSGSE